MLDFIAKGLAKIFGTKSDRDIKELLPKVAEINQIFSGFAALSDDQLREKTQSLRARIQEQLKGIDDKIAATKAKIEEFSAEAVHEKDQLFNQIDALEKERDTELEKVLEEVMPTAFAIVKETARRFKEIGKLEVKASPRDRELAATKANVQIQGEVAIWHNKWLAAGNEVVWDMVHYDVQLIGGMVLHPRFHPSSIFECLVGSWSAPGDRQRLPRQARFRMECALV
jgi:preprotein translocase subunit SecA